MASIIIRPITPSNEARASVQVMSMQIRSILILGVIAAAVYAICLLAVSESSLPDWLVLGCGIGVVLGAAVVMANRELGASRGQLAQAREQLAKVEEKLKAAGDQLSQFSTVDDVTGVGNARHFAEMIRRHRAMAERSNYEFTLGILEVDQFNRVVETEGLSKGNEVLELFTRMVMTALREVDVLARIGPDQFGFILGGSLEQDAVAIINRISQLIAQIHVTEQDDIRITASTGITSFHGSETEDELLAHARQALAFAVEQGRDRVAGYLHQRSASTGPASDDHEAAAAAVPLIDPEGP